MMYAFTLKQYQKKRDEVCIKKNVNVSTTSRGLVSLMQKEILLKRKSSFILFTID